MGRFGATEIAVIAVVIFAFVWLVVRALWRVGSKPPGGVHGEKEPGAVRRFLDE